MSINRGGLVPAGEGIVPAEVFPERTFQASTDQRLKGTARMHRSTRFLLVFPLVVSCGILSFFASLVICEEGLASPFETYGLGERGMAMGGAVSAIAEDYSATYYNPAGLRNSAKILRSVAFI